MSELQEQVEAWLSHLSASQVRALVDPHAAKYYEEVLHCIQAHEGSIWIKPSDSEMLVISFNCGPRPQELEGKVHMPLGQGLISQVYAGGKTICHQGMFRHKDQSEQIDKLLHQLTAHQVATPFCLFDRRCGVLSAIQTYTGNPSGRLKWGFDKGAIHQFETCAGVLQRLLEYNWLRSRFGLAPEAV